MSNTDVEHIKIRPVSPKTQYVGNGRTREFQTVFAFFAEDNIVVYLNDKIISSGFKITGVGNSEGGTVTFDVAPKKGENITIIRDIVIERITDFQEGGTFRAKNINDEFDRLTAVSQQVNEVAKRAIVFPPFYAGEYNSELPRPEAKKALVWNDSGTALRNSVVDFDQVESDTKKYRDEALKAKNESVSASVRSESSAVRSDNSAKKAENVVKGFDAHAAEKQNAFDVNAATLTARYDNNDLAKTKAFNQNAQDMTDGFNTNAMLKVDDFDAHAAVKEMEFDDHASIKQGEVDASVAKAKQSELNAKASEDAAKNSENASGISEDNARESERLAREYKEAAELSATNAKKSEDNAKVSENNSSTSENNASTSEQNAATSETNAQQSASNANISAEASKTSENNAKDSELKAKASENKCIELVNSLQNVYKFKGSVPTYDDLPKTDNVTGDVWNVLDSDINYAWTGTDWDALGGASTDLSDYVTKQLGMLLARDEEVNSSKTFLKDQAIKTNALDITTDVNARGFGLIFTDKNGTQTAGIGPYVNNNGSPECRLIASNGVQSAFAGLGVTKDGQGFFEVPTPNENSNNRDAINSEWINPKIKSLQDDINKKQPVGDYQTTGNLSQTLDASVSKYPSNKAVSTAIANIDLSSKQDKLSTAQLNAVNSGITSSLVTKYNGYEATINGKQNNLNTNQINACNSGITSALVTKYNGYEAAINGKQPSGSYANTSLSNINTNGKKKITETMGLNYNAGVSIPFISSTQAFVAPSNGMVLGDFNNNGQGVYSIYVNGKTIGYDTNGGQTVTIPMSKGDRLTTQGTNQSIVTFFPYKGA